MKSLDAMLRRLALLFGASLLFTGCAVETDAECTANTANSSLCDGAVLVAACGNREVRQVCDDNACPAGKRALGCRLDQDDRAFCQCGCSAADELCLADGTLRVCFGGELVDQPCTAEVCRQAGLGAPMGCGEAQDGRLSCLCDVK